MQFVFPSFLWAFIVLAVPIIIHLFYFRKYKRIEFTNVRFLKELVEETASRNRLKNLLILLSRLFALAALILAFAQPFSETENTEKKASAAISIYIDNSWSMEANSEDGSLLQKAKRRAQDIIRASSDNDRFQVITNEFEAKSLRFVSKEDAFGLLEEVKSGPVVQSLSRVLAKQLLCFKNAATESGFIYLLSDFQTSICDLDSSQTAANIKIYLLPIQSVQENNLSIDTAFFESPVLLPGQTQSLIYKISNYGNGLVENLSSSYTVNGQEYPGKQLNIAAGKFKMDTINLKIPDQAWLKLQLKIKDFPVQFDDSYYLCSQTNQQIDVLLIYGKELPIQLMHILESIPFFKVSTQQQNQINYSKLSTYRLIILNELTAVSTGMAMELKKAMTSSSNLFVFPKAETAFSDYKNLNLILNTPDFTAFDTSRKQASFANLESDVLKDVFNPIREAMKLPISFGQYTLNGGAAHENIISYRDGTAMISKIKVKPAYIFISATPLDPKYSDLTKNAELFLPLLFKAALTSDQNPFYAFDLSTNPTIRFPFQNLQNEKDLSIQLIGPETFIPAISVSDNELRIETFDQLKTAGIYDVKNKEDLIGHIAFNDSRRESNLQVFNPETLESKYGRFCKLIRDITNSDFTSAIQAEQAGPSIWWYCLIAAFLFLILESLFIRFWKNH